MKLSGECDDNYIVKSLLNCVLICDETGCRESGDCDDANVW